MLPKAFRLTGKETFEKLKNEGSGVFGRTLTLIYQDRNDDNNSRIGFIVSLKISKKAVKRNRIKRLLREAVRRVLKNLKPGVDLAFLTKREILGVNQESIFSEVNRLLEKAKLLK